MSYQPQTIVTLGLDAASGTLYHTSGISGHPASEIGGSAPDVAFAKLPQFSANDLEYLRGDAPYPGYLAWFDSTHGVVASGGLVSAWTDRTGVYTATQTVDAAKPSVAGPINGLPVLSFAQNQNQPGQKLDCNALAAVFSGTNKPGTVVWSVRPQAQDNGGGGGRTVAAWSGSSGAFLLFGHTGTSFQTWKRLDGGGSSNYSSPIAGATQTGTLVVGGASLNATSGGAMAKNGFALGATNLSLGSGPTTFDAFAIGQGGASGYFVGQLLDLFVYPTTLTAQQLDQTMAYCAQKAGTF